MDKAKVRPKLVYFMAGRDSCSPLVAQSLVHDLTKALAEFFEVIAIGKNCDYAEICNRYCPDLAMFDGAVDFPPYRLQITNTSAFPEIPKIGLINVDAYSPGRRHFFSEMERLGIETFFAWDNTFAEYTPEVAGQLFHWPLFVNTELFRDYGENKIIPVLFIGSCDGPYLQHHWRIKIKKVISQRYPSLIVPHPGWIKDVALTVYGERYARLINASAVVPTAGAMSKALVFKHLEIPAAKACLVTERTPIVEAFGFSDMENCVFADEHDISDKLDYLFTNRDVLDRITNKGYELVRSRHTAKQRPQIFQWLQLYRSLKPGQRIVQTGLFNDLEIVGECSEVRNYDLISGSDDRILLHRGDEKLLAGQYREAEKLYLRCLDYVPYMAEPKLRLAICKLYRGDPGAALNWIAQLIKYSLDTYEAQDPDPVEWAYLLVTLLCQGNVSTALNFSQCFSSLRHIESDRARWVVYVLANRWQEAARLEAEMEIQSRRRSSIHQLPDCRFDEYIKRVCRMLKSCKQRQFARTLAHAARLSGSNGQRNLHQLIFADTTGEIKDNYERRVSVSEILESLKRMRQAYERRNIKIRVRRMLRDFIWEHPSFRMKIKSSVSDLYSRVQNW
jgi:tetratricopeptide (TPR) repeat protein